MVSPLFPVPQDSQSAGVSDVMWFAGLAMQAIVSHRGVPESDSAREEIALWSIRMGQAMVAADRRLHASQP